MERIKIQIEHETKKAYLITDSKGRKGWIQKKWMAADGTVAEKTMAKASGTFMERKAAEDEAKEWANTYHRIIKIEKETEKAVAIKVNYDAYNLERNFSRLIWIPKSLIKDMAVQGWFLTKKIREAADELADQIRAGILCDYVPIENCENRML